MNRRNVPPSPPRSLLGRLLRGISGVFGTLFVALLLAVGIEWTGMTFFWADQGAARSAAVLRQDLDWLAGRKADHFRLLPSAPELALKLSDRLYRGIVVWSGLEQAALATGRFSACIGQYLQAALNTIQTLLVRMAITITSLPLFFVFALWGALEGTVRRDLRRFGGDIERGMIYHWAKHVAGAVLILPVVIYLAWPDSINPVWIFMPFAVALGINMMAVSATFTKYV